MLKFKEFKLLQYVNSRNRFFSDTVVILSSSILPENQCSASSSGLLHLQQQKPLAPRTISTYLSGVRKYRENEGVDTRFFMNKSQYIRNTKQGLAKYYRAHTNQTTGDRERMPVTADMISKYYVHPAWRKHHYCPTSSQCRNVNWLHGRGARIGIPPDPKRNTCAYSRSRSD